MSERLLTTREVAERLRVSVETVLRWVRRGEFEGVVVYLPSRGGIAERQAAFEAALQAEAEQKQR